MGKVSDRVMALHFLLAMGSDIRWMTSNPFQVTQSDDIQSSDSMALRAVHTIGDETDRRYNISGAVQVLQYDRTKYLYCTEAHST